MSAEGWPTTERFARESRDRRPITEPDNGNAAEAAELVVLIVSILAALFLVGLMIWENGKPLP